MYADDRLDPLVGTRWADLGGLEVFIRPKKGDWRPLRTFTFAERLIFELHGFDRRGATAYITHAGDHDTGALVSIELATGRQTVIAHRDGEAISDVLLHPQNGQPIGYKSGRLRQAWTVLDHRYKADFKRLSAAGAAIASPESDVSIIGRDTRDRLWLVAFEADVVPRRYYAYDRRSHGLRFLFAESSAREGLAYAAMHPVMIRARDGLDLTGYLTLPDSTHDPSGERPARALPMILRVHGGPQSRESWRFDAQTQWLASRGYAVLSINYRGSTGFGKRFIEAGYGEWGKRMQHDLVDSVRWAVRENVADPDRIAVLGLSYGGYAVLNALSDAADMFACGVETVGLSDLNLFLDTLAAHGKTLTDRSLEAEFDARLARDRMQLGGDERTPEGRAVLAARSPVSHARKIRAPVLITHGLLDTGVIPAHSEQMVAALEKYGTPVTYLAYSDEGHGLFRPENQISHAAITEAFLASCLGGRAAPFERGEFSESSLEVRAGAKHVPGLADALDWLPDAN